MSKPPGEIPVGEVAFILAKTNTLVDCSNHTDLSDSSSTCPVRRLWQEAIQAMFDRLHAVYLDDLVRMLDILENPPPDALEGS